MMSLYPLASMFFTMDVQERVSHNISNNSIVKGKTWSLLIDVRVHSMWQLRNNLIIKAIRHDSIDIMTRFLKRL